MPRGFTLIETMVVMGIIAILMGILLLTLRGAKKSGDVADERGMVVALRTGCEQFKQEFGFLPPLLVDTAPGPVQNNGSVLAWRAIDLGDHASMLNDAPRWNATALDTAQLQAGANRCSEFSLAAYLAGAWDQEYDGVQGLGFTAPTRDGAFTKKGRKHTPIVDPSTKKTRTGQIRLDIPGNNLAASPARLQLTMLSKINDRWSDDSNKHAIRYYRWLPEFYTDAAGASPAPTPDLVGKVHYWNVPVAVGGNFDPLIAPANTELRDAQFAVVSAGPDGLFGDEPLTTIINTLALAPGTTDVVARAKAAQDNIVEVGK